MTVLTLPDDFFMKLSPTASEKVYNFNVCLACHLLRV